MHPDNTSEERQNTDDIPETIHMEEGMADIESALSTISSLNTADIEALDKTFDFSKNSRERKCGGRIHLAESSILRTNIKTAKMYYIFFRNSGWDKTRLICYFTNRR